MYMPDTDEVCRSRRDAEASATEHASFAREFGDSVTGSARSGRYYIGEHYGIEITECDDKSCLDALDNGEDAK
jgi:hypothetical protein